jgi:CelD/BcsL family acetyltransferase involved in cellulose biosynthesis
MMDLKPGQFYARDAAASSVFDCALSHDELMSRLSKHFRRNVRAHRRKLESLGEVLLSTASDEQALSGPFEGFLSVEGSGWKGSAGTGSAIALHEELAAYYRQLVTGMTGPEDRCDINSLYVDGRCVAAQFCLKTGSDYTIMKIGFDEAYASLGPGQLLLDSTIQRCCEAEDITRLDLVSDSSWIRDWQAQRIPMRQAYVAVDVLRGRSIMPLLRLRHGAARDAVLHFRQATGNRYSRAERIKRRRAKAD